MRPEVLEAVVRLTDRLPDDIALDDALVEAALVSGDLGLSSDEASYVAHALQFLRAAAERAAHDGDDGDDGHGGDGAADGVRDDRDHGGHRGDGGRQSRGRRRHASNAPPAGMRVGGHVLVRTLDATDWGSVHLARHARTGASAAVRLLPRAGENRQLTDAARVRHGHLAEIYEVGTCGPYVYIVSEYVAGTTLAEYVRRQGRLAPARAFAIINPVLDALSAAHDHGVLHRGLKLENVAFDASGVVKLLDLGLADVVFARREPGRLVEQRLATTQDSGGADLGTLECLAPEQWTGDTVDERADIWAIGIMLYTMLAGIHPLAPLAGWQLGVTGTDTVPMPGLEQRAPDVPADLAAAVDRCLVRDPDRRMTSAWGLQAMLCGAERSPDTSGRRSVHTVRL